MRLALRSNSLGYMTFLFIFLSIIGGILEISYMLIIEQRFVVGGFFDAPIRPIYGFGGLFLYILPQILKKNAIILFMSSFVVCSMFEYFTSFFLEVVFNRVIWDYSNFIFNVNGRICLIHSIIWGFLGIIFYHLVEPLICRIYSKLRINVFHKSII